MAYNPRELRGAHGKWAKGGVPSFSYEGPPGGTEHARAMEALAGVLDREPGGRDTAMVLRAAIRSMMERDLASANRHLDGAIYQDRLNGGAHQGELRAVKESLAKVPKQAQPLARLPSRPAALAKLRQAGFRPAGVVGGDVSGAPSQSSGYESSRAVVGMGWADQQLAALGLTRRPVSNPETQIAWALGYIRRTAQTATASTVHERIGKPGGPGLWKHKDWQLPPYIQHVAHDLIESGHPESQAIGMAVGIVRNWAAGHDGKGHPVHPDVQAAAVKNIAQWEAMKARTQHGARRSDVRSTAMATDYDADGLDASWDGDLGDLPDLSGLGVPEFEAVDGSGDDGGSVVSRAKPKLGTGSRFAALKSSLAARGASDPGALAAYIGRKKFGKARFHQLASAARKKAAPAVASRSNELVRYYPLEECKIMRAADGERSGRVVEAYAAIWDTPAEIHDHEGHYMEEINRHAFDEVLAAIHPDRNGGFWRVSCLFNHGMTVGGTWAERFSLPAGVTRHISAEGHGLLTRTEYAETPLGDELLELVNLGALRSQSFTGGIVRSNPMLRGPGDRYRKQPGGALQLVRRLILGLREYGLTPFPAYSGAEVLGVRMQLPPGYEYAYPGGDDPGADDGTYDPGMEGAEGDGSGDPPGEGDASRSTGNRLYRLRSQELLEKAGIQLSREE